MMSKEMKCVTILLTDWQRRMVKDFLNKDCHTWEVHVDVPAENKFLSSAKDCVTKMYLTDSQIKEIRAKSGLCLDYIELEKEITQTIKIDKSTIRFLKYCGNVDKGEGVETTPLP